MMFKKEWKIYQSLKKASLLPFSVDVTEDLKRNFDRENNLK